MTLADQRSHYGLWNIILCPPTPTTMHFIGTSSALVMQWVFLSCVLGYYCGCLHLCPLLSLCSGPLTCQPHRDEVFADSVKPHNLILGGKQSKVKYEWCISSALTGRSHPKGVQLRIRKSVTVTTSVKSDSEHTVRGMKFTVTPC